MTTRTPPIVLGKGFVNAKPTKAVTKITKEQPAVVEKNVGNEKWMQDIEIRKPGICTGKKYGGPTCPPGSRQHSLAKTFRKSAKKGGKKKK